MSVAQSSLQDQNSLLQHAQRLYDYALKLGAESKKLQDINNSSLTEDDKNKEYDALGISKNAVYRSMLVSRKDFFDCIDMNREVKEAKLHPDYVRFLVKVYREVKKGEKPSEIEIELALQQLPRYHSMTLQQKRKVVRRTKQGKRVYNIEAILDHRFEYKTVKGKKDMPVLLYYIQWAGFSDYQNSWEPAKNIYDQEFIHQYWNQWQAKNSIDVRRSSRKDARHASNSILRALIHRELAK